MFRNVAIAATLAALPVNAIAEQIDRITDACKFAFSIQVDIEPELLALENVQSFPELSPPSVQFEVVSNGTNKNIQDALDNVFSMRVTRPNGAIEYGQVRCEFASTKTPVELTQLVCSDDACPMVDIERRSRELSLLLERAGY